MAVITTFAKRNRFAQESAPATVNAGSVEIELEILTGEYPVLEKVSSTGNVFKIYRVEASHSNYKKLIKIIKDDGTYNATIIGGQKHPVTIEKINNYFKIIVNLSKDWEAPVIETFEC